jgi:Mrp family chromosome partitioning ATPase
MSSDDRRAPAASKGPRQAGAEADEYAISELVRAFESPPQSATAIALRQAADDLVARQVDIGRRGLVVCAPSRGAGATFMTVNLAVALAAGGQSVLIVDANLHDPGVDQMIAPGRPPLGLKDLLADNGVSFEDVIRRDVVRGLSILYSGGAAPDASELVGGPRCAEIVDECLREFDFTLFDTPPANRSADARRLAGLVGYALIVGRRNLTYVDDVATLASELADDGAVTIGTIFNEG